MRLGRPCRAMSWRALALCCGRALVVSQPVASRVAGVSLRARCHVAAPLSHDTSLYRNPAPYCVPCRERTASYRARTAPHPGPYRSLYRFPYCDTNAAPSHDTIFVSRHSPLARPPACGLGCIARAAHRIVEHARLCCGRDLAISWPIPCALMPAVSRYNLLYRDSKQQMGSLLPTMFFFFHIIFFSHSSYWKTTKKKIFIFFFQFSMEQNKFLKIYFLFIFFFQFYTL